MQWRAALDNHAVLGFPDARAHQFQIADHGTDSVRFLNAQFFRIADDCAAFSERSSHGEDGQFVDHIRDFAPLDDGAMKRATPDFDRAHLFDLVEFFDVLAVPRAHADEDRQDTGPRFVQADVFDEQMRVGLRCGCDQPKRCAGNIARHLEISRRRNLPSFDGNGQPVFLRFQPVIFKHSLRMIAALDRL